jgi:uncharacterized protein YbbK (DUF523 family)
MALRDAIEQLAGDPALRTRLGEGGRRRVADEFTLEQMAERFVAVCREAAGLAGPNPPVETERREDSFIPDRRSRAEAPAVRAGATARARP